MSSTTPRESPVTVAQLATATGLAPSTIRRHCAGGVLAGKAIKVGRDWIVPYADAMAFATEYEPYDTLRAPDGRP